ncbi:unnamed protein product, partial [Nesidiocoris tenuis]
MDSNKEERSLSFFQHRYGSVAKASVAERPLCHITPPPVLTQEFNDEFVWESNACRRPHRIGIYREPNTEIFIQPY